MLKVDPVQATTDGILPHLLEYKESYSRPQGHRVEKPVGYVISSEVEKSVLLYCCPGSDLSTAPGGSARDDREGAGPLQCHFERSREICPPVLLS